jgi:aspartate/methionine/tyrosine aminotransferase
LRHRDTLAERSLEIISDNLKVLDQFFDRHAALFGWQRPQAGSIGFPRLLGEDVEAFCEAVVKSAGVLLLPGTLYEDNGNHFRIGFGRKNMPEAVARLEQFLLQF